MERPAMWRDAELPPGGSVSSTMTATSPVVS